MPPKPKKRPMEKPAKAKIACMLQHIQNMSCIWQACKKPAEPEGPPPKKKACLWFGRMGGAFIAMLARPTCHGSHRHRRPRCRRRGLPGLLDALVVFLLSIPGAIFVLDPVPASGARAAGRQRVEGRRVFPRWREVEPARHSRRTACMFIQKPASSWMRPGAGRSRARSRGQGAANLAWSVVPQPQLPMHLTPHKYPKPINPKP